MFYARFQTLKENSEIFAKGAQFLLLRAEFQGHKRKGVISHPLLHLFFQNPPNARKTSNSKLKKSFPNRVPHRVRKQKTQWVKPTG